MIIDCVSDLHGHYPELQGGDLLIVAGDCTSNDSEKSWINFEYWLINQNYKEKVIVSGNHDNFLQSTDEHRMWKYWDRIPHVTYLCDSETEFEGLKIWGSPWTKTFPGINPKCCAFTVDSDEELAEKWGKIPTDLDILVTHCPPNGIFDSIYDKSQGPKNEYRRYCGSTSLRNMVLSNHFPKLKLHVFGHIHEHGGKTFGTTICKFINASYVDERYQPVNKPIRIEL